MKTIISLSILFVVAVAVCYFLGGTESFGSYLEGIVRFVKKLLCNRPKPSKHVQAPAQQRGRGSFRRERIPNASRLQELEVVGTPSSTGKELDVTLFDRKTNTIIGSKRLIVGADPILIGRGIDLDGEFNMKLCLPDMSNQPTTSRRHCTIALVNGIPTLTDCYTQEQALVNGKNKHSMSYADGKYVGSGLQISCPVRVNIGDYTLLLEPVFQANAVPTFGAKESISERVPTFGADDRESFYEVPTKEFHPRKRG